MQRYRVNYGLLIGLCVGLVVVGAGGYFLLKYQLDRNADQLLRRADIAEEEGKVREAAYLLRTYCNQRPGEVDAARRMANLHFDILSEPDVERRDYGVALGITETVVRNYGDQTPELRQRLASFYMAGRRWVDALKHIDVLVNADPNDSELQLLRSSCLVNAQENEKAIRYISKLVGLNRQSGEFDVENALGPDLVAIYPLLARLIVQENDDRELARAIVDQMVDTNPDSALAYVRRAQYLTAIKGEDEEADQQQADNDLAKALELDPKNVQVLLANSVNSRNNEDFATARKHLASALKEHPDTSGVYLGLARLEIVEREEGALDRAIAHLDQGIEAVPAGTARDLKFFKAYVLADTGDADGLSNAIKELEETGGFGAEQLDFLRGRLDVINRRWFKAAERFNKIRPVVSASPEMGGPTNYLLGLSYQNLGQNDLALEALTLAVELQPKNQRYKVARDRLIAQQERGKSRPDDDLTSLVRKELEKPAEEQDWLAVDEKVEAYAEAREFLPVIKDLLRADILTKREKYAEARALVDQALATTEVNQAIPRVAIPLIARDPDRGPVEALKQYNAIIPSRFADTPAMRLIKADLLIAIDDESLKEQLLGLADGLDDWEVGNRIALLKGLSQKFAQLRDNETRRQLLTQITALSPGELSTLLELFQTAIASGNAPAVEDAQSKILELVGSKEDPTWLFTEAARLTYQAISNDKDPMLLAKANDLIDRALGKREGWHLLYLTRADIAFARGDRAASLAAMDKADQLGPMTTGGLLRYISLLSEAGRSNDALAAINRTAPAVRQRLFGRQYAELLLNAGSIDEAVESAKKFGEAGLENSGTQLWLGRFMRRVAAKRDIPEQQKQVALRDAEQAIETAVELAPEGAEGWLELAQLRASQSDRRGAETVLRRAQLALPADQATVVMARGYEIIGRFFDAESLYRTIRERQPDDLGVMRQMAAFYLSDRYPRDDSQLKATRLINEILAAATEPAPTAATNARQQGVRDANIRWARRSAAEILSRSKDYQNLLKAERLLNANAVEDQLTRPDKLLMAKILAPRPEPASRLKAIQMLEEVKQVTGLDASTGATLGQLYFLTGSWDKCRTQMTNVISNARENPTPRAAYIRMLLKRGDSSSLAEAARQLKSLRQVAPKQPTTLELVARVFTKFGKEKEARKVLVGMLRDRTTSGATYINVARLLADLGDIDTAEKIYTRLADQSTAAALEYGVFLGKHREADQGFKKFEELRGDADVAQVCSAAMQVVRALQAEADDALFAKAQKWLDRGLREDPESISMLLLQAELRERQKLNDAAIATYRRLLDSGELSSNIRALVLNNLAYLLALTSEEEGVAEEAMRYVAEAIDILGPSADILDTRAVVLMAQGNAQAAIEDLELSLTDNPTASKHFHMSQAYYRAGDLNKAVEEWDNAVELGLERGDVSSVEQAIYDKLEEKVQSIRGGSVSP